MVLALALTAQPINRWITHKISGKKGAPLYNDDKERILTPEEKTELNKKKAVAIPMMWGVTALSMFFKELGILIASSFSHPAKAPKPMLVTLSGILHSFNESHP